MKRTVLDSLNDGLLAAMLQDDSVLLLGEDILDPTAAPSKPPVASLRLFRSG